MSNNKDFIAMMKREGFLEEGEHQEMIEEIVNHLPDETQKKLKDLIVEQQLSKLKTKIN